MLSRLAPPLLLIALTAVACNKKSEPAKLKKMDFKVTVDDRGRMLPEIELFDQHHAAIVVAPGSYTLTLSRPDNTVLCSVTRTLAKEDYEKKRLKVEWQDATCPPDPAAEELRVTLEVKSGDKPDAPKLSRDKTTPTKFIYRHLAAKQAAPSGGGSDSTGASAPGAGSGSSGAAGSGSSGAAASSDADTSSGAAASGSNGAAASGSNGAAASSSSGGAASSGSAAGTSDAKMVTPEKPAETSSGSSSAGSGSSAR